VSSRAYDEYVAMFDLGTVDLTGRRVLDCSAGAANFAARARAACRQVVAADPAYAMSRERLSETTAASRTQGTAIAEANADCFTWDWFGSREARGRMRARALAEFLLDLQGRPSTYVAAALPHLPFADGAFDLALCSHLLFTWADQLGLEWHLAALRELTRVCAEARVFPTVVQGRGEPVPFWDELIDAVTAEGIVAEVRRVPYEFQRGGDRMLVVSRSRSHPAR